MLLQDSGLIADAEASAAAQVGLGWIGICGFGVLKPLENYHLSPPITRS